jgi:hypothetical protein
MASFPIVGSAGLDDCSAGEGACEANGCTGGTCNENDYQMSYPYYGDCIENSHCHANETVPYAGNNQCFDYPIYAYQRSCADIAVLPSIKDCGPPSHYSSSGYCVSQSQEVIACFNTGTFSELCDGCNPMIIGLIGLTFEAS